MNADEDRWDPDLLSVPAGAETVLLLRNQNWIAHTFHSDELGIDVYMAPRTERIVEIDAMAPGTYGFACDVTGHEMMIGTLRVT
jgi:heme/copper-type cytochrome/quinol oxidase subunit 2